jgi:hypothetical protein
VEPSPTAVCDGLHAIEGRPGTDRDAILGQGAGDDMGGLGLLPGQQAGLGLDDDDRQPEPSEGLGQLAADRAAAQHRKPDRKRRQREDALVCQVVDLRRVFATVVVGHRHHLAAPDMPPPQFDLALRTYNATLNRVQVITYDQRFDPAHRTLEFDGI